jgi:hypothetical protein
MQNKILTQVSSAPQVRPGLNIKEAFSKIANAKQNTNTSKVNTAGQTWSKYQKL